MATHVLISGKTNLDDNASWESGVKISSWSAGDKFHSYEGDQECTGLTALAVALNEILVTKDSRIKVRGLVGSVNNGTNPGVRIFGSGGEFWLNGTVTSAEACGAMQLKATGGTWANVFCDKGVFYRASGADCPVLEANDSTIIYEYHATNLLDTLHLHNSVLDTECSLVVGDMSENSRIILRGAAGITDGAAGGKLRMRDRRCILEVRNAPVIDELRGYKGRVDNTRATANYTITLARLSQSFDLMQYYPAGVVTTTTLQRLGPPGAGTSAGGIGGAQ